MVDWIIASQANSSRVRLARDGRRRITRDGRTRIVGRGSNPWVPETPDTEIWTPIETGEDPWSAI